MGMTFNGENMCHESFLPCRITSVCSVVKAKICSYRIALAGYPLSGKSSLCVMCLKYMIIILIIIIISLGQILLS